MTTQAIIELWLRGWKWVKVGTLRGDGSVMWEHDQVEVFKTTEEATVITQQWEDLAFDDDGPEPKEDDCA